MSYRSVRSIPPWLVHDRTDVLPMMIGARRGLGPRRLSAGGPSHSPSLAAGPCFIVPHSLPHLITGNGLPTLGVRAIWE